jgi:hypothetical protein
LVHKASFNKIKEEFEMINTENRGVMTGAGFQIGQNEQTKMIAQNILTPQLAMSQSVDIAAKVNGNAVIGDQGVSAAQKAAQGVSGMFDTNGARVLHGDGTTDHLATWSSNLLDPSSRYDTVIQDDRWNSVAYDSALYGSTYGNYYGGYGNYGYYGDYSYPYSYSGFGNYYNDYSYSPYSYGYNNYGFGYDPYDKYGSHIDVYTNGVSYDPGYGFGNYYW